MGERLPAVTDKKVIKVARKLGFSFYRQAKGSYEIWHRAKDNRYTTIPCHRGKTLKRKTFKSILKDFKINPQEFRKLLRK